MTGRSCSAPVREPSSTLPRATRWVAFEVDEVDPVYHSGWSVLLTGIARDATAEAGDSAMGVTPRWAPAPDDRLVAISVDQIIGRRLGRGGPRSSRDLHDST